MRELLRRGEDFERFAFPSNRDDPTLRLSKGGPLRDVLDPADNRVAVGVGVGAADEHLAVAEAAGLLLLAGGAYGKRCGFEQFADHPAAAPPRFVYVYGSAGLANRGFLERLVQARDRRSHIGACFEPIESWNKYLRFWHLIPLSII